MIPKILIKGEKERIKYRLLKEYKDFVLYENIKTGAKECFSKFSLGLIKEKIKPERQANRGGIIRH